MTDKTSIFTPSQFPEFLRSSNKLVTFVQTYYKFLEQANKTSDVLRNFKYQRDSDLSNYLPLLEDEYMVDFPKNILADPKLIIKHMVDFYKAKGSEQGYRLLFRILFNKEIDFYYPGDDILRLDDGRWDPRNYITINLANGLTIFNVVGAATIVGNTSGTVAEINDYEIDIDNWVEIKRLFLRDIKGTFIVGETLKDLNGNILGTVRTALDHKQGVYIDTYGFLDSNKRMQDDFYYQEYSYVIKNDISQEEYVDILYKLIHPSGTKLFTRFDIEETYNSDQSSIKSFFGIGGISQGGGGYTLINRTINNRHKGFDYQVPYNGIGIINIEHSTLISALANEVIGNDSNIPIGDLGTGKIAYGINTHFTFQLSPGTIIRLNDGANTHMTVDAVYSDTEAHFTTAYTSSLTANNYFIETFV